MNTKLATRCCSDSGTDCSTTDTRACRRLASCVAAGVVMAAAGGGGYHGGGWGGGYRGGGYHRGWGGPGLIGGLALGVGAVVGGAVALATAPVRIVAEAAAPPPAYYPPAPAYYGYGQGYYARPAAYSYPAYTTYAYPEYPQQ